MDIFSNQNLLELIDFFLVYTNENYNAKRFKIRRQYLPKGIIKNYNFIINGKNCSDQAIDSDIKQYREVRKLTAGKAEDYTNRYLLDYDHIKTYYRLIAVDLSRQKELDTDAKAIQQIEFVRKLKNQMLIMMLQMLHVMIKLSLS